MTSQPRNGTFGEAGGGTRGTVLVTGGAGYIGSLLVRRLLARSYRVRVMDVLLYGDHGLRTVLGHPALDLIVDDFRRPAAMAEAVAGVDAVIHLGGIVGDPACALDPALTLEINQTATRTVATACERQGVERLLFASSCSVYGASDGWLDEESALAPVSLYARTKIASELMLLDAPGTNCIPVIFRFATVFGLSPRPRFDLVVNLLIRRAIAMGQITINGGEQWRPFVHADDIGEALVQALEAPRSTVAHQVFNVGSDDQNYQLRDLGDVIQELVPGVTIDTDTITDRRNYRVRFGKIQTALGFQPRRGVRDGMLEIKAAITDGLVAIGDERHVDNYRFLRDSLDLGLDAIVTDVPRRAHEPAALVAS